MMSWPVLQQLVVAGLSTSTAALGILADGILAVKHVFAAFVIQLHWNANTMLLLVAIWQRAYS